MPANTIVNDLRYAYVRQGYQISGTGTGNYVNVYGFTQPTEICNCDTLRHVPRQRNLPTP